mgnify:CR=1 FL=1
MTRLLIAFVGLLVLPAVVYTLTAREVARYA